MSVQDTIATIQIALFNLPLGRNSHVFVTDSLDNYSSIKSTIYGRYAEVERKDVITIYVEGNLNVTRDELTKMCLFAGIAYLPGPQFGYLSKKIALKRTQSEDPITAMAASLIMRPFAHDLLDKVSEIFAKTNSDAIVLHGMRPFQSTICFTKSNSYTYVITDDGTIFVEPPWIVGYCEMNVELMSKAFSDIFASINVVSKVINILGDNVIELQKKIYTLNQTVKALYRLTLLLR